MASVCGIFLWLTFGDFLGKVAQRVEFGGNRLHRWQCRVGVALLRNELTAHFGGA
jgi:hypothetical protein